MARDLLRHTPMSCGSRLLSAALRSGLICASASLPLACDGGSAPPGAPQAAGSRATLRAVATDHALSRARTAIAQAGHSGESRLLSVGADGRVLYGEHLPAEGHGAPEYTLRELDPRGSSRAVGAEPVTDAIPLPDGRIALVAHGRLSVDGRVIDQDVLPGLSASPDGKWIVYARGPEPESEIHRATLDRETPPHALTADGASAQLPSVSRDGRTISYVSNVTGLPSVWSMDLDGRRVRQLTNVGLAGDVADDVARALPAPDGRPAVFDGDTLVYFDGSTVRAISATTGAERWFSPGSGAWSIAGNLAVELGDGSFAELVR